MCRRINDRIHEWLAKFEQTDSDRWLKTDTELPGIAVMLLGATLHESVGILTDDQNMVRAIAGVVNNTYYEGRIHVIDIWIATEYMESRTR